MTEDEVVREVRAAREAFAASHGYDIHAMVAALRELGIASGREVVRLAPRPAVTNEPAAEPNPVLQGTPTAGVLS
jgi:hypothetical protein